MLNIYKKDVLKLLKVHSYEYKEEGFTLASGEISKEYLDCKKVLCDGESLKFIATALSSELVWDGKECASQAVGGLTMGADPIAIAMAMSNDSPLYYWFSIRKTTKTHGTNSLVVGNVTPGTKVCIVEDVITTGASTIEAITKAKDFGLEIVQVLALVDREQGGLDKIKEHLGSTVKVSALCTLSEIKNAV